MTSGWDDVMKDLERAYPEAREIDRLLERDLNKKVCRCEYKDYANGNHRADCPEREEIEKKRPRRWRY